MDYKQKFIDYAKGKVKDLGNVSYIQPIWDEEITEKVVMISDVRNFKDLRIVTNLEEYDEPLKALDEKGNLVIDTRMYDANMLAADLMFSAIDTEFYYSLLEYWNELPMDEYMENNEEGIDAQNVIDSKESINESNDEIVSLNIDKQEFLNKLSDQVKSTYTFNDNLYNKTGDIEMTNKENSNYTIYIYRDKETNKIHLSITEGNIDGFAYDLDEVAEYINKAIDKTLSNFEESKLTEDNNYDYEYEYLLNIKVYRNDSTDNASLIDDMKYITADLVKLIKSANSGITEVIVNDLQDTGVTYRNDN